MHRRPLIQLLERYRRVWPDADEARTASEHELVDRFLAFVKRHDDCLLRSCAPGHITASCWILDAPGEHALFTHHRKLERWLQLGGHVDGEAHIERAALREAQEESGMARFEFIEWQPGGLVPLDLDVHPIPARGDEPRHDHWDVRFLLRAAPGQPLAISDESNDLRWVPLAEVRALTDEPSVVRLHDKAHQILGGASEAT